MKLKKRHISDLNEIVNTASKIQGVIGIILFGSLARGDYDEYSDYDLLVLFESKDSMWQSWDNLFEAVGTLKFNVHIIPQTLEELTTANPIFLNELLKYGKILFARSPLEVFLKPVNLKSFCLISYNMSSLNYRDKMKIIYSLYRKGGGGTLTTIGGTKLSDNCILIPNSASDEIAALLSSFKVETKKLEIYINETSLKAWQSQKPLITQKESAVNIAQQVSTSHTN